MLSIKHLRQVLKIDLKEVEENTGLSNDRLRRIEDGLCAVPSVLSDYFASRLHLDKKCVSILLVEKDRRVPYFEACRRFCLKLLNGYLRFSLWMSALDETPKKIPH